MMNFFKIIVFVFSLILIFFTSCDKIEEPYLKEVGGAVDTTECPVPEFLPNHNPVKRGLLEDYTGHTCVNCPAAAVLAHDLLEAHGEQLVVIAVHAGFFAQPAGNEFLADYRTEAGTTWDDFFGISTVGNPNGMVDRTGYPSNSNILSPGAWSGRVNEQLAKAPELDMQIINDYDTTERKLCTHVQTEFLVDKSQNLKLCVVLTESGIISPQRNNDSQVGPTPVIEDYEHEHMLRGDINSPWGVAISSSGEVVESGSKFINSYKMIFEDGWVSENCIIVAFVYDADTYEVLQVMEKKVH
jgi:hypothetical protein